MLTVAQQTGVNQRAVGSLALRVRKLSESLCEPITTGGVHEKEREKGREGELEW